MLLELHNIKSKLTAAHNRENWGKKAIQQKLFLEI